MDTAAFEEACVGLVAFAGEAKNDYFEAVEKAEAGDFEGAEESFQRGDENYQEAHRSHFAMMQLTELPQDMMSLILLIHAEDQLSSAETYKLFSRKLISLYRKTA